MSLPTVPGQEERSGILPGSTRQESTVGGHQDDAQDGVTKSLDKELNSAAISDAERNSELERDLSSNGALEITPRRIVSDDLCPTRGRLPLCGAAATSGLLHSIIHDYYPIHACARKCLY